MSLRSNRVLIYLGHLTYDSPGRESNSYPLNIGFLKTYAKKHLGDTVDIRLFGDPQALVHSIKAQSPKILALSNYIWNSALSDHVFKFAKNFDKSIITVQGGPNYPFSHKIKPLFWESKLKFLDYYIDGEGEETFRKLLEVFLDWGKKSKPEPMVPGLDYWSHSQKKLIFNPERERMKDLEESIPSPILSGVLDDFILDPPLLQTNRGCPFLCTFCHEGDTYYNKVNNFSLERITKEVEYIRQRGNKFYSMYITDSNFGMLQKDLDLIHYLHDLRNSCGWPTQISVSPTKRLTKKFTDSVLATDGLVRVGFHFQSTNDNTLKFIKRKKPNEQELRYFYDNFHEQNYEFSSLTSLIIPMPEETFESYLSGLKTIVEDYGISQCNVWTLEAFWGNVFDDPDVIAEYGMKVKYRLVEGNFGEFSDFSCMEIERACIATNTFSEEDYYKARFIYFFVSVFYLKRNFYTVRRYLKSKGLSPFDWILFMFDKLPCANKVVADYFNEFDRMTREELFNSPDEIRQMWNQPQKRKLIIEGRIGYNVIQLCTGNLANVYNDVLLFAEEQTKVFLSQNEVTHGEELNEIFKFMKSVRLTNTSLASIEEQLVEDFSYDIPAWVGNGFSKPLESYYCPKKIKVVFSFNEKQKKALYSAINFFPSRDIIASGKFFYRVNPETFHRKFYTVEETPHDVAVTLTKC